MAAGKKARRAVLHPSQDPGRRSLRVEEWPERDQQAWQGLFRAGDGLDPGGAGEDWPTATRNLVRAGYGQWLAWLQRTGRLDAEAAPADQVLPTVVGKYVKDLEPLVGGMSIAIYVDSLRGFCRAVSPASDWRWFSRLVVRLRRRAGPGREKRDRMVPISELFALGLRTMHEAEAGPVEEPWRTACRYRDGLIVALLAARPVRLRNLGQIEIGRHLIRQGGGYLLQFEAAETKSRRSLEFPLPEELVAPLDRYLSHHRPLLCAQANAGAGGTGAPPGMRLWVSGQGTAMIERSIYQSVVTLTGVAFGKAINPHLFRDCAATSVAIEDPEHIRITISILGHSTLETSERYYNHAKSLQAMRRHQNRVLELREQSRCTRRPRQSETEGAGRLKGVEGARQPSYM